MDLSIVVPCYNEEQNIPLILKRFADVMEENVELILVNNGSTDNSSDVFDRELRKSKYSFVRLVEVKKNVGYGHGILSGLKQAKGKFLAWTHADMQTDPGDVLKGYKLIKNKSNSVLKGKRIKRKLGETLFTFGMSVIASIVLRKMLFDVNAQPKIFPKEFYEKMLNAPDDFSLDLYWLYLAKKEGYEVLSLPVYFKDRIYGESKWAFSFSSRLRTILRTIRYIFALKSHLTSKR